MKKIFQYYGFYRGHHYFTLITDDESGRNQVGIDVCWHHFKLNPTDRSLQGISYMDASELHTTETDANGVKKPSIAERATDAQAKQVFDIVSRSFHPFFDDVNIVVGHRERKDLFNCAS